MRLYIDKSQMWAIISLNPILKKAKGEKMRRKTHLIVIFFVVLALFSCKDIFGPLPKDVTLKDRFDVKLSGKSYGTLKLIKCVNIDITNCKIKNLVIEDSVNIEVVKSTFNGEGTAVVSKKCMAVSISGCKFTGNYESLLSETRSIDVRIK